ncbi:hypothetical protein LOAG_09958, partial [Loa loa]
YFCCATIGNLRGCCFTTYSFDGAVIVSLLLICTCAYLKRVPRINSWFLSEKKGFFGIFYKVSA